MKLTFSWGDRQGINRNIIFTVIINRSFKIYQSIQIAYVQMPMLSTSKMKTGLTTIHSYYIIEKKEEKEKY